MARPSHTQSNPLTPPGATITYISVVHGASRKPTNGTQNEENVTSNRSESRSHHTTIAVRGPKNSRTTNTHMMQSSRRLDGGPRPGTVSGRPPVVDDQST